MATYKCTFRGRVGIRDEIRAELYICMGDVERPGLALDRAERIVVRQVPNFLIKGRSVRRVAEMEHTMIRVHRFHRVLEGEIQDDGTVTPIQPLTITAVEEQPPAVVPSMDVELEADLHNDSF